MAVDQNPCFRGAPPLLQTFVAGPLLQTLVADLCAEYCSLQGACRGGVCRRTPPSVTNLCREMAAQACYKANVFDSLPNKCDCSHMREDAVQKCSGAQAEARALQKARMRVAEVVEPMRLATLTD